MADILIRGMEMPEHELKYVSLWVYGDGRVYVSKNADAVSSKRLHDLAVPLPEGHGRLGDLDALLSVLAILKDKGCDGPVWDQMRDIVNDMVTIVPAEGGGEDG